MRNAGGNVVTVSLRVDNPGANGAKNCNTGSVTVNPGDTATLTVRFRRKSAAAGGIKLFGMRGDPFGGGAEPWQLVPLWVKEGKPPPVDVPQPILTFTEPIVLDNPEAAQIPTTFILTVEAGKETDDFDAFAGRARDRGWDVVEFEGGHNPQWFQPEAFVDVLLQVVQEENDHQ